MSGIKNPGCCRAVAAVKFQAQVLGFRTVDFNNLRFDLDLNRFGDFQQIHHFFGVGAGDFLGPGPLVLVADRPFQNDRFIDFRHPNVGIAENALDFIGNPRIGSRHLNLEILPALTGPHDQGGGAGLLADEDQLRAGGDHHVRHFRVGDRGPLQAVNVERP